MVENNIPTDGGSELPDPDDGEPPFVLKLSEGGAQPDIIEVLSVTAGEPLSVEETANILARLPALTSVPEDILEFNLPDEPLPPPVTGETIDEPFPPSVLVASEIIETGPLEVLRYAPEGEIPIAPFVSITFNQPMVPLTTIDDLASRDVPVQIAPSLPGTWRWLGTKTLNFQYDSSLVDRMPMATKYQVTIPAGIQSATGGILSENVTFSFSTPPPTVVTTYPHYDPQSLEPLFFISFDQRIDPQSVLDFIHVTAKGRPIKIRLASVETIAEDKIVSALAANAPDGRWLAFKASSPLPSDSAIDIEIGPGTPSAEGPLVTKTSQLYNFYTYAPLEIVDHGCSWHDDQCRPLMPFTIEFNNAIDGDSYEENMLQIDPELPGASVNIYGNHVQISGVSQGQTTYRITVDGNIRDVFGQILGVDQQLKFKVGSSEPYLVGPDETFVTLDPSSQQPSLSLYTINHNKLDIKIYAVKPSDWPDFMTYITNYQRTDEPKEPPGKLVHDEVQEFEVPTDMLTQVSINLSDYMESDFGHFIIIAKPHRGIFEEENYWETIQTWVQVTQIGLDVFTDHSEMVVWTSNLNDGSPLSGAAITSDSAALFAKSGQDGIARFNLPTNSAAYLVARVGSDQAMLPRSTYYWDEGGWYSRPITDTLRWYVFDDRQMYRPGEEVHIKGWLRNIGGGQFGDVGLVGGIVTAVNYQLFGSQGNEISSGNAEVNALGGFDIVLALPENVNLGHAQLQFNAQGSLTNLSSTQYYHSFQIQEFRRPEFEVSARNESTGPFFAGDHAIVAVEAKYFAGGPLPGAETTWWVTTSPTNYQPPNWPDFNFGKWIPWWSYYQTDYEETSGTTYTGKTDASGTHYLRLDFGAEKQIRPMSILAEATVMDVNRQAWSSSTGLLVHPADIYVGLRSERTLLR
jgi:hypothetical protein